MDWKKFAEHERKYIARAEKLAKQNKRYEAMYIPVIELHKEHLANALKHIKEV